MSGEISPAPDGTAIRVALWRALHVQIDSPPHVLDDQIGLQLAAPSEAWRRRPDMDPQATASTRASIVARGRFIEDLVLEETGRGVSQYVILGAGLDTFAQRRRDVASDLRVFEVDRPGPQAWKRQRLIELGLGIPERLRFVPVDFEKGESWWEQLVAAGFDAGRSAVVASAGVSQYLTKKATATMLRRIATFAHGTTMVMTFMPPLKHVRAVDRPARRASEMGARAARTPFISFFTPVEIVTLARRVGLAKARSVSAASLARRYFAGRKDGLRPSSTEAMLVATI